MCGGLCREWASVMTAIMLENSVRPTGLNRGSLRRPVSPNLLPSNNDANFDVYLVLGVAS
jgi:hypothetical protein